MCWYTALIEVQKLVAGGIDFIKDDELQADGPNCPFDDRVRALMRVITATPSAAASR